MDHRPSRLAGLATSARGAGEMVVQLVTPWRRAERTSWGSTLAEQQAALPGDDLVPEPTWAYTHAISIAAPPVAVWPWVVQLGQGRGGFYSFEGLENLVGCHVHNTDRILAEHQALAVGDPIRLHPKSPPLHVDQIDPGRCLVLAAGDPPAVVSTWSFHLTDEPDGGTRLIERGAYRPGPSLAERLSLGPAVLEPVSFVMSREMLRTIRSLAAPTDAHARR